MSVRNPTFIMRPSNHVSFVKACGFHLLFVLLVQVKCFSLLPRIIHVFYARESRWIISDVNLVLLLHSSMSIVLLVKTVMELFRMMVQVVHHFNLRPALVQSLVLHLVVYVVCFCFFVFFALYLVSFPSVVFFSSFS